MQSYIYIITNYTNSVLYTGVTSNLVKRIYEHKNKLTPGFSSKYNLYKLVYYEMFEDLTEAMKREKQIKGGSRKNKVDLVRSINPNFKVLYSEIV